MRSVPQRLQMLSLLLPLLKCAVCPVCLSLYGGLFAGARLGAVGLGQLPEWLLSVVLVADLAILGLAFRHHRRLGPLLVCAVAGGLVGAGHMASSERLELLGFAALIGTAFWNWWLLRELHRSPEAVCSHCAHHRHLQPGVSLIANLYSPKDHHE